MPRAHTSVVINTRLQGVSRDQKPCIGVTYDVPLLNSAMIASRSFCTISPCIEETVKLAARIFSVNQSTFRSDRVRLVHGERGKRRTFLLVLQKMTA